MTFMRLERGSEICPDIFLLCRIQFRSLRKSSKAQNPFGTTFFRDVMVRRKNVLFGKKTYVGVPILPKPKWSGTCS